MEDNKQEQAISDAASPAPEPPQPETVVQPQTPTSSGDSSLDTSTKSPVVASKDNSNLKLTIIIVLAVVVALALIGAGYVAFMSNEKEVVETDSAATNQPEQIQAEPVDSATIDQESAEIDGMINELDEETDFPEDELNDASLGL